MNLSYFIALVLALLLVPEFLYRLATRTKNKAGADTILVAKTNARYEPFDLIKNLQAVNEESGIHEVFWREMQSSMNKQLFVTAVATKEGLIHDSAIYNGTFFSTLNGRRTTTMQPTHFKKTVALFGGSTIFCYETEDSHTVASHLQHMANNGALGLKIENYGVAGASAIERCRKIRHEAISFMSGDEIVLLFGDNDCGWVNYKTSRPVILTIGLKVSKLWRSLELLFLRWESKFSEKHAHQSAKITLDSIFECALYCETLGVKFTAILQPNIYTKNELTSYDKAIISIFGARHRKMIGAAYTTFKSVTESCIIDATDQFDDIEPSVFLDWAHVESRGNKRLAEVILQVIMR